MTMASCMSKWSFSVTGSPPETKKRASDAIRRDLLEAAHELGARNIKAAGEMWTDVCDVPRYAEAFADVCADAAKIGTAMAIEILPMTNIRRSKRQRELSIRRAMKMAACASTSGTCCAAASTSNG